MTATIISGKELSERLRGELADDIKELSVQPSLAVILIGDDPASHSYVRGKEKACAAVGIHSIVKRHPASLPEEELLAEIEALNEDSSVHGILVQLPLPDHISENAVLEKIVIGKDVDGFHPVNVGRLLTGKKAFTPCTPLGIMKMLEISGVDPKGKRAVVVGRSQLVGRPVGQLLLNKDATVTYCHSKTEDLASVTREADILIAAAGRAGMIGAEHVKDDAVVIDVGVNRMETGKLTGDVQFEPVREKAGWLTPVPGGVGPMTITMLLHNTVEAARGTMFDVQS
ncbi:bifunctional methylenetetrahydrofolate dehydrogenase/methenyltetrahydrofolate cyclohydrolase FolD [Natribacillus halophilus]|uniref:Bifunctional protein FolD n=1 Tax=Natribacillus halophilus TaxID=549003 RepID=A0A1G8JK17_9BACI|nr:bifunctional methylenetetrahydrofolate dehydrogenase/methenyltetrahydrofolate cyclohydrolase FolD [Natribacillus halophilus]SDI31614.1 methenyltetrahydrofolate cyclohydrolase /5,10-methylenetetrahydrofolate dehydrogenase (NADP+) [Natribacillus halophilus]